MFGRRSWRLWVLAASGGAILGAWLSRPLGAPAPVYYWLMLFAAVLAGVPVARQAWGSLQQRQFSIALLVTVATVGAIVIGEVWEAAAVTFLYVLGGWLEELTLAKTRQALRSLIDLSPRTAKVIRDGVVVEVPVHEVAVGERVVVQPGDRVPVDGPVLNGRAALDTATLTGEPLPQEVGPGERVLSGSLSQGGYLEIEAERVGADTTFSRMIYLVAEAQEQKPQVQQFMDRFAQWYTPLILVLAPVLWLITGDFHLALTFLVIGCPGALVVATPVAVVAGLGSAARQGILIKGGERLEQVSRVDVIAFDKTGTLTQGKPEVVSVVPFAGSASQLLALAAAAEQRSEHHLAKAILERAAADGVAPVAADDWHLEPGLGAVAVTAAGEILVGNRRLLASRGIALSAAASELVASVEARGETVALVASAGEAVGLLGITDRVRPEALSLVASLKAAGVRDVVMLTGDHALAAQRIADEVGISAVRAGLSPEQKVAEIAALQAEGHVVGMVGDGINDAPALAAADISIAMGGSGTKVAGETADIVLMTDRLERVPGAIGLARRILGVVRQNVAFAVLTVLLLLVGVVTGKVFLALGMLVHEASVLLVILNGMRLLRRPRSASAGRLVEQPA